MKEKYYGPYASTKNGDFTDYIFVKQKPHEAVMEQMTEAMEEDYDRNVAHPAHYANRKIEVIDYIEDCGFGEDFCLGNVIKYVSRAGRKDPDKKIEDLQKAQWYLNRCIDTLLKEDN